MDDKITIVAAEDSGFIRGLFLATLKSLASAPPDKLKSILDSEPATKQFNPGFREHIRRHLSKRK